MTDGQSPTSSRRDLLAAATLGGAALTSGCLGVLGVEEPGEGPEWAGQLVGDGPEVRLEPLATGLTYPTALAAHPERDAWYVADQVGVVYRGGPDGLADEPFLDLRDRIVEFDGFDERGLLGLALHPDFPDDGRLFVRYSAPPGPDTPAEYSHRARLASFEVEDDDGPVDPATERTLLEIQQPYWNHNSGSLAFGPEGYLYVCSGDGGDHGDTGRGHVEDWYDANGGGNGQDTSETLLGGILRLDVDAGDPYAIPEENPLVDRAGHRGEYYAWGLRNPWGISFDGRDGYVADVGQNWFESVNLLQRGGNYGWNVREGTHCFDTGDQDDPPADCPDATPADVRGGEPLLDPVIEYPHRHGGDWLGLAVVGGHVYRGDDVPALEEHYVFGDWSTSWNEPRGSLFVASPPPADDVYDLLEEQTGMDDDPAVGAERAEPDEHVHEYVASRDLWPMERLSVQSPDDAAVDGELRRFVTGFGRTSDDELLVLTAGTGEIEGSTGRVYRLTAPE